MSIIAVNSVPPKLTLPQVSKTLMKSIKGEYEALGFRPSKRGKICFVKLSEKLDPMHVIEAIRRTTRFGAYMPDYVPDLPPTKTVNITGKRQRPNRIAQELSPAQVLVNTHSEILAELQSKYTGLYNLAKKTGFKLLESIARTIFERLKQIAEKNPEAMETGFKLSKCYRMLHPHFGDFQLILSTLHRLQDAAGVARAQISESDLTTNSVKPYVIDNVPIDKVQAACNKYSDRIIKKITEHINSFNTEVAPEDSEEELARKNVRAELKKITQYLPEIIRQVISNQFVPQKSPFHKIRIYGEPHLPPRFEMQPFINRHQPVRVMRSDRMYNLLRFNIPISRYCALMAMDGTVIGDAKLVIRSSDIPLYGIPKTLRAEMRAVFGEVESEDKDDMGEEGEEEEETGADDMEE